MYKNQDGEDNQLGKLQGENHNSSSFWKGDNSGNEAVGLLVAQKWIDEVMSVARHRFKLITLR